MRDDRLYLDNMIEACESIARFVRGVDAARFLDDELVQSAVTLKLLIVGEATAQLSADLKARHPSIPWQKIKGFRNHVIHGYFSVAWGIVWTAATVDVPSLLPEHRRILAAESACREIDRPTPDL